MCAQGSGTDPLAPFVSSTLSGCPEAAPKPQSASFWSLGSDRTWSSEVPAPREEVGALRLSARRRLGAQRPRLHRHLASASFSAAGRAESVDFGVWGPSGIASKPQSAFTSFPSRLGPSRAPRNPPRRGRGRPHNPSFLGPGARGAKWGGGTLRIQGCHIP